MKRSFNQSEMSAPAFCGGCLYPNLVQCIDPDKRMQVLDSVFEPVSHPIIFKLGRVLPMKKNQPIAGRETGLVQQTELAKF